MNGSDDSTATQRCWRLRKGPPLSNALCALIILSAVSLWLFIVGAYAVIVVLIPLVVASAVGLLKYARRWMHGEATQRPTSN